MTRFMVQKSQGQPPGMVLKSCKSWDKDYRLVISWISSINCVKEDPGFKPEVKVYSLSPMVEVKKVFEIYFVARILVEAVGLFSKRTYDYKAQLKHGPLMLEKCRHPGVARQRV